MPRGFIDRFKEECRPDLELGWHTHGVIRTEDPEHPYLPFTLDRKLGMKEGDAVRYNLPDARRGRTEITFGADTEYSKEPQ